MPNPVPLQPGKFYHIYNRGNNGEILFYKDEDYRRFLKKYIKYCFPVLETYAYCLMNNHFHLLVKVRSIRKSLKVKADPASGQDPGRVHKISAPRQLTHLFNSHAQYINKQQNRTGSLFEKPFKRKLIANKQYLKNVIQYIHWNPQFHEFTTDFSQYPHSSYGRFVSNNSTRLNRESVFKLFGGRAIFIEDHKKIVKLPGDDFTFEF